MIHLDLYSGFGGFRLAVEAVWSDSELHAFVEIDPFCQKWLKANWPGCRIISNAKEYNHGKSLLADTENTSRGKCEPGRETKKRTPFEWNGKTSIDILTGGPPCQPVSVAGKGKGDSDDRWQWPTMLRIIQDVAPTWIVFENVSNLINFNQGILFDGILTDMETAGYETATFVLPACSQNAPHRRDRVFVVGNAGGVRRKGQGESKSLHEVCQKGTKQRVPSLQSNQGNVADTDQELHNRCRKAGEIWRRKYSNGCGGSGDAIAEATTRERESMSKIARGFINPWSDSEWITGHDGKQRRVPISPFRELASGISTDYDIPLLEKGFPHRNDLLKGFGNAICWPVVIPIMEAIKCIEKSE